MIAGLFVFRQNSRAAPLNRARVVVLDCNNEIPIERQLELAGLIEALLAGPREPSR